jgi:hypothetical protein
MSRQRQCEGVDSYVKQPSSVMLRAGGASSIPEALQLSAGVSGILDRPVKPGDDTGKRSSTPATPLRPGFAKQFVPPKVRGRRECRAPVAPAALRANKESTQASHHGHAGNVRHSPRNGFNGFLRGRPGDRALLSPSSVRCASIVTNLTSASGCQAHTTSPSACPRIRLVRDKRPPHLPPHVL